MPYKTITRETRQAPSTWLTGPDAPRITCPECGQRVGIQEHSIGGEERYSVRAHQDRADRYTCEGARLRVELDPDEGARLVPLYGPRGWYDSDRYADERQEASA